MSTTRAVFKYTVELVAGHEAKLVPPMPAEAKLLHVGEQMGKMLVWAQIDQSKPIKIRRLNVFGTGHKMPEPGTEGPFIGTLQLSNGLVFHFFDGGEREPEEWELD